VPVRVAAGCAEDEAAGERRLTWVVRSVSGWMSMSSSSFSETMPTRGGDNASRDDMRELWLRDFSFSVPPAQTARRSNERSAARA
jgi:hypothetical protein